MLLKWRAHLKTWGSNKVLNLIRNMKRSLKKVLKRAIHIRNISIHKAYFCRAVKSKSLDFVESLSFLALVDP